MFHSWGRIEIIFTLSVRLKERYLLQASSYKANTDVIFIIGIINCRCVKFTMQFVMKNSVHELILLILFLINKILQSGKFGHKNMLLKFAPELELRARIKH